MAASTLVLVLAEVEDVAVGLGRVENAVGAGEGLDQAVVLEVLVDVERVEVLGVEAGEEHVDDDGDVDLFLALAGQVAIGELLILDALLDVLVVGVEVVDVVVRAILLVVVGDDGLERGLLALGVVAGCPPSPGEGLPGSAGHLCCPPQAARRRRRS